MRNNKINVDGLSSDDEVAAEFAKYFEGICSVKESDYVINSRNTFLNLFTKNEVFSICEPKYQVSIEVVEEVILAAKSGKAAGIDGLMAEHLKFAHPILCSSLKKLFNLLLDTGFVPDAFGLGLVFPIPKNSNASCCFLKITDFRGITISPVISKIFEHCLIKIFDSALLSSHFQFGFKKGKGCRDALFVINETIEFMTDNLSTVNICFVDLSKAFDNINHYVLFKKLLNKRVPICLIKLLVNWYTKCFCFVKWGSSISRIFLVSQGVRQGGVLSPILFSLYVDDALVRLNETDLGCNLCGLFINAIMYADDIILMSPSIKSLQNLVNLCELEFRDINLGFNVSKCASLRIGARHKVGVPGLLDLQGASIHWVAEYKYLGIVVKSGLNFKVNVHQNKVKFFRTFNALFAKLGSINNPDTLIHLVKSNCLSILLYNIEAVHLSRTNINELSYPLDRAYVKVFHVQERSSISWCQFYMNQLPVELLIDSKRFWYLLKLENTQCPLMSHVFGISSIKYIETLWKKYEIIGFSVETHKLSKAAMMKNIWKKFDTLLSA